MKKVIPIILTLILFCKFNIVKASSVAPPIIQGKSGITVDYNSGEIIYAYNIDTKMYPASITKLMTALLLTDKYENAAVLKYTAEAKEQEPFTFDNNVHKTDLGTSFSADEALHLMLMISANDMATMIADNISGNTKQFSQLMNNKASELKMENTHFANANGLQDSDHYTTAYDLSILGKAAFSNPFISKIMGTKSYTLKYSDDEDYLLKNTNKILGTNGCIAGKTGFTKEAGRCLLTIFERNGRKIIGVVLGSPDDKNGDSVYNDTLSIMNWSYNASKIPFMSKGDIITTVKLQFKPFRFLGPTETINIPIKLNKDLLYFNNYINDKEIKTSFSLSPIDPWNINKFDEVGKYTLKERSSSETSPLYSAYSTKDIMNLNKTLYIKTGILIYLLCLILVLVVALTIQIIHKHILPKP